MALMSLVFILVITLITLISSELKLTDLRKQKVMADCNARMGLMVAIGELQRHLGPDTRLSSTAAILDEDPATEEIEGVAHPHWTGVWKRQAAATLSPRDIGSTSLAPKVGDPPPDVMFDSEYDDHPANEVAWLVSGNEGKNMGGRRRFNWLHDEDEDDATYHSRISQDNDGDQNPDYYHPALPFPQNGANEPVTLVQNAAYPGEPFKDANGNGVHDSDEPYTDLNGNGAHDVDSAWLNKVRGGSGINPEHEYRVQVIKTKLTLEALKPASTLSSSATGSGALPPGAVSTGSNEHQPTGAYGFYVGDLGVKTKANVVSPYKDLAPSGPDYLKAESNLLVSPEPNLTAGHNLAIDLSYDAEREKANNLCDLAHALAPTASTSSLPPKLELKKQYHELTTDSFGVLSDAFRGGLRRDLTAYFGTPDTQWDGDGSNGENELNQIPLFKEKVLYLKEFAAGKDKANFWRYSPDEAIRDDRAMLAGPMWSVLRGYYDLHEYFSGSGGASSPHATTIPPSAPDRYPQRVADHYAVFDTPPTKNGSAANHMKPFIRNRTGYDRYGPGSYNLADQREEPTNHPVGPVLVELQHRQILYTAAGGDGQVLRLAIMPTFALWNPYNVRLAEASYQMEYVVNGCTVAAYNTKEREIFYKWAIHSQRNALLQTTDSRGRVLTVNQQRNRHLDKNGNYYNFGGLDRYGWGDPHTGEPYMDINLNGRYDPGEPFNDKNNNGHHDGGGGHNDEWHIVERALWHHNMAGYFGNGADPDGSDWVSTVSGGGRLQPGPLALQDTFLAFRTRNEAGTFPPFMPYVRNGRVQHFRPYHVDPVNFRSNRPALRLRTEAIAFEPGEKLVFAVAPGPNQFQPGEIVPMVNHHGLTPNHHVYFEGDASRFSIPNNDPITVRHLMHGAVGFRRGNSEINHDQLVSFPNLVAKGTVLYLVDNSGQRLPIQKINKEFGVHHRVWRRDYAKGTDLSQGRLAARIANGEGLGFRIRRRLSSDAQRIVFQEFNPRALVDSYQDGSGDLWRLQAFNRTGRHRNVFRGNRQHVEYYSRYTFDGNATQPWTLQPNGLNIPVNNYNRGAWGTRAFNPEVAVSGGKYYGHLGHSHDMSRSTNPLVTTPRLALYDVPRQPMLSIGQFRHANLNWYSHSPAYVVGNSYATGQVSRFKKSGKVSRIIWQPEAPESPRNYLDRTQDPQGSEFNHLQGHRTGWWWDTRNYDTGMGILRDKDSETEHQNVTIDHSYYANEALFDGYYFSSVPTLQYDSTFDQVQIDDGTPLPNGRLKYFRDKGKAPTLSELRDPYDSTAHLLVDGAFNVNSTSVETWMAQLASLSGMHAKMLDVQDNHKLSASTTPQEVTFGPDEFPFLRHVAPLGEGMPPASDSSSNPNDDYWTGHVILNQDQLRLLAEHMVEQVKSRGPFLSLSDFINRRLSRPPPIPGKTNSFVDLRAIPAHTWQQEETPESEAGFRGVIQAAIANAGFNSARFSTQNVRRIDHDNDRRASNFTYLGGVFGEQIANRAEFMGNPFWGRGIWMYQDERTYWDYRTFDGLGSNRRIKKLRTVYKDAYDFGEAPENLQAVENSVSAAMMPGWLSQGDVLEPLAPVISPRSDSFVIRAFGEADARTGLKRYCEAVVQRIPQYVVNEKEVSFDYNQGREVPGDPARHRPREPFDDWNGDGEWNSGEPWLDLNRNAPYSSRLGPAQGNEMEQPDLPGGPAAGAFSAGLPSDQPLQNRLNEKFGRQFRIVKFRWLTEDEV